MSDGEGNLTGQWSPIGFSEKITGDDVTLECLRTIQRFIFAKTHDFA